MHLLHRSTLGTLVGPMLALILVLIGLAPAGTAHAQSISQGISVAVVPFTDSTAHQKELIAEKATDAVALALDDSQEYVVTLKADMDRELQAMGVTRAAGGRLGISKERMLRLGQRLRVEKVAHGSVDLLTIQRNGSARCRLTVRLLDVDLEEYLDGATGDHTTKPIPGWKGDETEVIDEVLRSAAEDAVRNTRTSRLPRGNVDMVDSTGLIMINLGFRDGIQEGMELLVARGVWNKAQERMEMQKIGIVQAKRVEVNLTRCQRTSGKMPRTSDKVYAMYRDTLTIATAARKTKTKKSIKAIAAGALLLGIIGTAMGPNHQSAPGAGAYLSQSAPGAEPRIRVLELTGNVPGSAQTFAWLVYRGEARGFPAEADNRNYLISAVRGSRLDWFEDSPERHVDISFQMDFTFLDEEGEQEEGDVDITYNHVELVAGRTYYYKLRRIVDPGRSQIPIADTGQAEELADVDFDIDPHDALGNESRAAGPVTFFYPAEPETPSDGNLAVDPGINKTVFTWGTSVGADQYQVMVYDNPQAVGVAKKKSPVLTYTGTPGGTMNWRMNTALEPSTDYYWFVGGRKSLEGQPKVISNGSTGWILSEPYSFRTAPTPPPTPTGAPAADGGRIRPNTGRPGWWGESERRVPRP